MLSLIVGLAQMAQACPEAIAEATTVLEARRADYAAARKVVRDTDWEYYLALDDRDEVLARQAAATEELRQARAALKDARRQVKVAAKAETPDMVCDPEEAITTAT